MVRPAPAGPTRLGVIHVHSNYSRDGRDSLDQLRAFALARGIGFVALTDHAEDFEVELFDEYVAECRALSDERVQLIPGLEFRFPGHTGLHLLALGLRRWITPQTPGAFIALARPVAGLTVLAHPVLARYRVPRSVLDGIDAIEVWNANYNTRYLPDPQAIAMLHALRERRPEVVGTAGLDQHDRRNDRETRVIVDSAAADPIAELRAGRFANRGRTLHFDAAVTMSPLQMRALTVTRWAFDRLERTQEHLVRALRGVRVPA